MSDRRSVSVSRSSVKLESAECSGRAESLHLLCGFDGTSRAESVRIPLALIDGTERRDVHKILSRSVAVDDTMNGPRDTIDPDSIASLELGSGLEHCFPFRVCVVQLC